MDLETVTTLTPGSQYNVRQGVPREGCQICIITDTDGRVEGGLASVNGSQRIELMLHWLRGERPGNLGLLWRSECRQERLRLAAQLAKNLVELLVSF